MSLDDTLLRLISRIDALERQVSEMTSGGQLTAGTITPGYLAEWGSEGEIRAATATSASVDALSGLPVGGTILYSQGGSADMRGVAQMTAGTATNLNSQYARLVSGTVHSGLHIASLTLGNDLALDAWTAPTFAGSWVNYGLEFAHAAYCKDRQGIVHIRGLIKNPSITTVSTIFTLPVGYRPSSKLLFMQYGAVSGNSCRIDVANNGDVLFVAPNVGSIGYLSLNLVFRP